MHSWPPFTRKCNGFPPRCEPRSFCANSRRSAARGRCPARLEARHAHRSPHLGQTDAPGTALQPRAGTVSGGRNARPQCGDRVRKCTDNLERQIPDALERWRGGLAGNLEPGTRGDSHVGNANETGRGSTRAGRRVWGRTLSDGQRATTRRQRGTSTPRRRRTTARRGCSGAGRTDRRGCSGGRRRRHPARRRRRRWTANRPGLSGRKLQTGR